MPDLIPHLTPVQRLFVETIYRVFKETLEWPAYQYLARVFDERDLDLDATLEALPPGLYWPRNPSAGVLWHSDEERLGLRVRGLACCEGADQDVGLFVAAVRFVVAEWRAARAPTPQQVAEPDLPFDDFVVLARQTLGREPEPYQVKLVLELMRAEPFVPSWAGPPDDVLGWRVRVSRDVRRFRDVETVLDFLAVIPEEAPFRRLADPAALLGNIVADYAAITRRIPLADDGVLEQKEPDASDALAARRPGRLREAGRSDAPRPGRPRRQLVAGLITLLGLVGTVGALLVTDSQADRLAAAIVVGGLAALAAVAVGGWPRSVESANLIALIVGVVTILGAGAGIAALGSSGDDSATTTAPKQSDGAPTIAAAKTIDLGVVYRGGGADYEFFRLPLEKGQRLLLVWSKEADDGCCMRFFIWPPSVIDANWDDTRATFAAEVPPGGCVSVYTPSTSGLATIQAGTKNGNGTDPYSLTVSPANVAPKPAKPSCRRPTR